jgi:hypothetical protein
MNNFINISKQKEPNEQKDPPFQIFVRHFIRAILLRYFHAVLWAVPFNGAAHTKSKFSYFHTGLW